MTLWDHSSPDSSAPGILQARILEWVTMPSFRGSSQPRVEPESISCIGRWVFFTTSATSEAHVYFTPILKEKEIGLECRVKEFLDDFSCIFVVLLFQHNG